MHEAVAKPRWSSVGDPRRANPFPMLTPTYRQDTADWLLTDNVSSWPGTPADRGWRYLKLALERHDGLDTDYRYNKAVLEAILSHDRALPPPPWLIQTLEVSLPPHSVPCRLRSLPPFPLVPFSGPPSRIPHPNQPPIRHSRGCPGTHALARPQGQSRFQISS
jgi:hypothetical protein